MTQLTKYGRKSTDCVKLRRSLLRISLRMIAKATASEVFTAINARLYRNVLRVTIHALPERKKKRKLSNAPFVHGLPQMPSA